MGKTELKVVMEITGAREALEDQKANGQGHSWLPVLQGDVQPSAAIPPLLEM